MGSNTVSWNQMKEIILRGWLSLGQRKFVIASGLSTNLKKQRKQVSSCPHQHLLGFKAMIFLMWRCFSKAYHYVIQLCAILILHFVVGPEKLFIKPQVLMSSLLSKELKLLQFKWYLESITESLFIIALQKKHRYLKLSLNFPLILWESECQSLSKILRRNNTKYCARVQIQSCLIVLLLRKTVLKIWDRL